MFRRVLTDLVPALQSVSGRRRCLKTDRGKIHLHSDTYEQPRLSTRTHATEKDRVRAQWYRNGDPQAVPTHKCKRSCKCALHERGPRAASTGSTLFYISFRSNPACPCDNIPLTGAQVAHHSPKLDRRFKRRKRPPDHWRFFRLQKHTGHSIFLRLMLILVNNSVQKICESIKYPEQSCSACQPTG